MEKQYNPLENWRGSRSVFKVAHLLRMSKGDYLMLEERPFMLRPRSDRIILISQITGIPLPVLVDWLTETTKEMA